MHAVDRPGDLGFDPARLGRIRGWMEGYVASGRFPFACTVIARRGEIAYCDYLGLRDVEAGAPYALDTIVRVYSMTKPITSVAIMMLYEEGRLHLDDPLAVFLPGFAEPRVLVEDATRLDQVAPAHETLTLHRLLTHTSGLIYGSQGGLLGDAYRAHGVDFGPAGGGLAQQDPVGASHARLHGVRVLQLGLPVAVEPQQDDLSRRHHVELRVAGGAEHGVLRSRREARQSGALSGVAMNDPKTRHDFLK